MFQRQDIPALKYAACLGTLASHSAASLFVEAESEARSRLACMTPMRSAALIRVKSSCGFKVSNRAFRSLFVLRLVFKNLEIYFCSFSLTPRG